MKQITLSPSRSRPSVISIDLEGGGPLFRFRHVGSMFFQISGTTNFELFFA